MPIYMDRHDFSGVTASDVAAAHQEDLKIQAKYGCRGLTYWFDEERQTAFCLIEGPDQEAVKNMHLEAHGLVPFEIIEVDTQVVKAFLGRIEDPQAQALRQETLFAFKDSAFRTLMATELKEAALLPAKVGPSEAQSLSTLHKAIIRASLLKYEGQEVRATRHGFLASFVSASQAVRCALAIQEALREQHTQCGADLPDVEIGLSAGTPVNGSSDFFGKAIQLATRLCKVSGAGHVVISATVKDLFKQEETTALREGHLIRTLNLPEERFLNQLYDLTETAWQENNLTVQAFAKACGLSKSQLYRKTVSLLGYSPVDFVKEFRLTKAVEILESQQNSIAEVAYDAGFTSPSYFSKCFQQRFHILPSSFVTAVAATASL
ncbi:nickel-binding protein [Pontibacter chitinilyticus]|uniref:nickel-binding protein n=1 Tax=Pontibacter chitinilyticus TaxID=2674989 RepID=UPI00321B98F8